MAKIGFDGMHELSIADSIIKTASRELNYRGYSRVEAIGVRIGSLSDIVPDALTFGFEALTKDTELESTRLRIELVPVIGLCQACHKSFKVTDLLFECPDCTSREIDISMGQEIEIAYLEFVEAERSTDSEESHSLESS